MNLMVTVLSLPAASTAEGVEADSRVEAYVPEDTVNQNARRELRIAPDESSLCARFDD
jgi:hypothetical protein